MRSHLKIIAAGLATAACVTSAAFAGGHAGNPAVKARQAHMQLYAFNLGILGAMAKGEAEYDADAAAGAASNMASLSGAYQMAYWVPGTDADSVDTSKAAAAMWDNIEDAIAKGTALNEASVALAAVAGDGLEALQGAMGPVGAACGSCHKAYRLK